MSMSGIGVRALRAVAFVAPSLLVSTDAVADRLHIDLFAGEVVNNFATKLRPDRGDDATKVSLTAGVDFEYGLKQSGRWRIALYGETIHSRRQSDAKAAEALESGSPTPDEIESLLESSTTLEWLGGLKVGRMIGGDVLLFAKLQGGFIAYTESGDDVFDNHFVGVGVQHADTTSPLEGSYLQFGAGRTDLFPGDRSGDLFDTNHYDRWKIGAVVDYQPDADSSPGRGYFLEGWLDTDFGSSSDDIQIYFGIHAPLESILK